jgi:hypothetical protein
MIADAQRAFESRWTLQSLRRVNPELYVRFTEQQEITAEAQVTGSDSERRAQEEALERGWRALVTAMQNQPENAYLTGLDGRTGLRVAISEQLAVRVVEQDGERMIHLTPDEVATLLASVQGIALIKQLLPGAVLTDLYPGEPRGE